MFFKIYKIIDKLGITWEGKFDNNISTTVCHAGYDRKHFCRHLRASFLPLEQKNQVYKISPILRDRPLDEFKIDATSYL